MSKKEPNPAITSVARRRQERFEAFAELRLRLRSIDVRDNATPITKEYARLGIGSDQIWNYDYGLDGTQFADFAPENSVVTLSPSVGHEKIPAEWIPSYRRWLARFEEVGTREIEWTRSLGARADLPRFTLLIDPTLMHDRDSWSEIAAPSPVSGMIIVYHLGAVLPEHEAYIARLADHHSLEVVHLSESAGTPLWETDAADFIGMIEAAACVVTDSYHGAIFAFLFGKPLVLLERHGFAAAMNTRTRTLVERLCLTDRYADRLPVEEALTCDYSDGIALLQTYRAEYWEYLRRQGIVRSTVASSPEGSSGERGAA